VSALAGPWYEGSSFNHTGKRTALSHLVFSQLEEGRIPLDALRGFRPSTRSGDELVVTIEEESPSSAVIGIFGGGANATFRITSRPAAARDVSEARDAEQRGRAAGMGDLAARCGTVYVVDPGVAPDWLVWELCAALAFAGLGPILPPDRSTLYGVNGARALAEKLRDVTR
jgi:hypothetical protein